MKLKIRIKIIFSADLFEFLCSPTAKERDDDARREAQASKLGHDDDDDEAGRAPQGDVARVEPAAAHGADAVEQDVDVVGRVVPLLWVIVDGVVGLDVVDDDGADDGYHEEVEEVHPVEREDLVGDKRPDLLHVPALEKGLLLPGRPPPQRDRLPLVPHWRYLGELVIVSFHFLLGVAIVLWLLVSL